MAIGSVQLTHIKVIFMKLQLILVLALLIGLAGAVEIKPSQINWSQSLPSGEGIILNGGSITNVPGAAGDGATDDKAVLQAAIDSGGLILAANTIYAISAELSVSNDAVIMGQNSTIKLMPNRSNASRVEMLNITDCAVSISGITFDGNKENQANYPDTPASGVSYGASIRLNNASNSHIFDVNIEEYHGHGILMYDTNNTLIENVKIKNCGNKRAVAYDNTTNLTYLSQIYKWNGVGDGIYLSNCNANVVMDVEIGHDADIQPAASLRAGIVITEGQDNIFDGLNIYNVCRAIHLEPDSNDQNVRHNIFRNIYCPDVGQMMTCVVLYETTTGQIRDNLIENFNCLADNIMVDNGRTCSVYTVLHNENYLGGKKVIFKNCDFPEYVMTAGGLRFQDCEVEGFQDHYGSYYGLEILGCNVTGLVYLNVTADLIMRDCKLYGDGHYIGGADAITNYGQHILLEDNYFKMTEAADDSFFNHLYAPATVRGNTFNYVSASANSTYYWIVALGRTSGNDAPLRVDSNRFINSASYSPAAAVHFPWGDDATYTSDGQNTIYGRGFASGLDFGEGNWIGVAATKA